MEGILIKNIIIGIDGGCFEMILPLIKNNYLPNFQKIMEKGFHSQLLVTVPPVTIPSWPCLFSGLTPYQLGYFWFQHPTKGLFNSNVWKEKAIFSLPYLKSFILNVPGTYPTWNINGEMVGGMLSPNVSCSPKEIRGLDKEEWIIDGRGVSEIFKSLKLKTSLFLKKLEEDYNLLVYVIRAPDALSHTAYSNIDKTMNFINLSYKLIDDFIGKILSSEKFDNLFIVSDHGLNIYKKEFNLLRWLEKKGLLWINEPKENQYKSIILKVYDIVRPFHQVNFLKFLQDKLQQKISAESKKQAVGAEFSIAKLDKTNIQKFSSNIGGLFLKRQDKLKKDIIKAKLESDKHIDKVIAPNFKGFPDLYIILKKEYIFTDKPSLFVVRKRSEINHTREGICIAYGKNIKNGKMKINKIIDFIPTILKLYSINKFEYMYGNPIPLFK